ncbi:low-density lipoprotein receptor-related protein 3-like [Lytechinus pictus]|uniref:low-density lipoprotein receptor-related protein 3-like n=1 Tax=Lytechinus pictus TaxID=7653 RepID=UPI0030B9C20F
MSEINMASLVTKNARRSVMSPIEPLSVLLTITLLLTYSGFSAGIKVVYLTSHCGSVIPTGVGGLLEAEAGLKYKNNIDCTVTLSALPTHRIMVQFHRFTLESGVNGKCPDSLRLFDGNTVDDPALTAELCGRFTQLPDYVSSGSNITVRFKTDDGGQSLGFGIYFTQVSVAPCLSDEEFECNNTYCIDRSLVCNTINMCGDWSDEGNCTAPPPEVQGLPLAAIVGIGVAIIFVIAMVVLLILKIIQYQRQRMTLKRLVDQVDKDVKRNPYARLPADASEVIDQDEDESYVLNTDDIGLSGKVFGRKRSSKVAPAQYDS